MMLHWQKSVFKNGTIENHAFGTGTGEISIGKVGTRKVGPFKISEHKIGIPKVGLAEVNTDEDGLEEFLSFREGVDDCAMYVLNLYHLGLFFDAKVRIFFDSTKFIFQEIEK